jgi:hypothetical protein
VSNVRSLQSIHTVDDLSSFGSAPSPSVSQDLRRVLGGGTKGRCISGLRFHTLTC